MKSLLNDERGLIEEYIDIVIAVAVICVVWILCNEFVFKISDVAANLSSGSPGQGIMIFALQCWRLFPFLIILGTFAWALLQATRHEGYTYPTE